MASVHKKPNSPFWLAVFRGSDGSQKWKSTKTRNKAEAEVIANKYEKAARLGKAGKLSPDAARDVLSEGLQEIFLLANAEKMPVSTTRDFARAWLESKQIEVERTSFVRYEGVIDRFLKFLEGKATRDIATLTAADVANFRDLQAKELSLSSALLAHKVLKAMMQAAWKRGLIPQNVAAFVDKIKMRGESKRRPFTIAELKKILVAAAGTEWEGLVLFGVYSGQRLGDLARMTWRAIDVENKTLSLATRKTGKRINIPLATPLLDYLTRLPAPDAPDAPLFPRASSKAQKHTGTLSNEFYEVLLSAGLVLERPNTATSKSKGRNVSRPVSEISFHSLRHTATTFLKAAGVSDALAREIIGHQSSVVSRSYTHLSTDDLRGAVEKLPDITGS